ncbi:MAG: 2-oxoglutarate dehydrogenase, subunit, dihydrolipoamide succinyltransferase [Verrucomicrobiales bacterium]|nr:2-oxoglutarate dehydrogenase, subunit, dihydrolipoamide succinyltransferase [Verrucomicrobiales bacterium]
MPIELKVPSVGESITEVEIGDWLTREGDFIEKDKNVAVIETEKATVELPSPISGNITKILKRKGETAKVGEVIALIEPSSKEAKQNGPVPGPEAPKVKMEEKPAAAKASAPTPQLSVAAPKPEPPKGPELTRPKLPGGRLAKHEDHAPSAAESLPSPARVEGSKTAAAPNRQEETVRMSKLRRTIATRLVEAQRNAALLTTFNEVDMTNVMALRKEHGEAFLKRYGVKLGFMSFFVKASIDALKQYPAINAEIRGEEIVYKNYFDIGVAIGGGKGLVVPVLRNAEALSFAEVETTIGDLAKRAQANTLKPEELQGGTFTITNGGVYGSLLSTPIVNPPQSGVLGLHSIQERPIALNGAVVIRSMMYLALTYDHRIVDGREAVSFVRRIKDTIENPARMLLEV